MSQLCTSGPEAARALTAAAFEHLSADRVEIHMDQANHASAAIPPKLGYVLATEDVLRERLTSGHTGKGDVWVMTRERWAVVARRRARR